MAPDCRSVEGAEIIENRRAASPVGCNREYRRKNHDEAIEACIIPCQSKQRKDCFQKDVIKCSLRYAHGLHRTTW